VSCRLAIDKLGGHKKDVLKLKVSLQVVQADTIGLTVQHALSHTTLTSPSKPSSVVISVGTTLSFNDQEMSLEELKAVEGRKTQEHTLSFVRALMQSMQSGFWHEVTLKYSFMKSAETLVVS